jgi:hypothetical protein
MEHSSINIMSAANPIKKPYVQGKTAREVTRRMEQIPQLFGLHVWKINEKCEESQAVTYTNVDAVVKWVRFTIENGDSFIGSIRIEREENEHGQELQGISESEK